MEGTSEFLATSPIARAVSLPGYVILKHMLMSPAELFDAKAKGTFEAGDVDTDACELEIGGQLVATGRIVKRRGRSYLRITHVSPKEERTEGVGDE
jgi:hypothetical protein